MSYQVGNKIKIREDQLWVNEMIDFLGSLNPPYVVTIKDFFNPHHWDCDIGYKVEEEKDFDKYRNNNNIDSFFCFCFKDKDVEGIYEEPNPITSRFEILDL